MSIRLLSRVAPGYGWKRTGVNIYSSADGEVEVSIIHYGKRGQGYFELKFLWKIVDLIAEGWVRDGEEAADAWSATCDGTTINAFRLAQLPHGSGELVWLIFVLLEIARIKAA